ncbi:MAG TPA: protein kinase [Gemmataceae bacterium]|nr:protein kinase [Gemmataceae bacterium]
MTLHDRLVDLLLEAEELRQRGLPVRAEELCRDCPELLPSLEQLLGGVGAVENLLHVSPSGDCATAPPVDETAVVTVPQLPGYTIHRELGRGGMGVVYEAEQLSLGRRVALKILLDEGLRRGHALERFRREARAAARLHHSNIVPVFEVGQHGDTCYYAMQLIRGQGLDKVVDELRRHRATPKADEARPGEIAQSLLTGRFQPDDLMAGTTPPSAPAGGDAAGRTPGTSPPGPPDVSPTASEPRGLFVSVARIGQQVAAALAYAHERGIIHRDVKPSNLLLDEAGVVWVTDFGLAKTDDDPLTHTGDILGTFRYMAPERFQGRCDPRADVYALGTTLYELIALRPAYDAPDRLRLIDQIKNLHPRRLRSLDPHVPPDLETIVLKAMDKEPGRRYATADDMAEDLRLFLGDEPIRARRVTVRERVGRWCRHNPLLAGLAAAVFLSLTLATTAATVGYVKTTYALGQEEKQRREADHQKGVARREASGARYARYLADMQLAAELWPSPDGSARDVRELLEAHVPQGEEEDLREFAWRYQWNLLGNGAVTFHGHDGAAALGAFAPDGRLITIDGEYRLRVWDTTTRRAVQEVDLSTVPGLWRVDLAPDGKAVAVGTTLGTVRLIDVATGRDLRVIEVEPGRPVFVRFLGDSGTLLAFSGEGTAQVWQTATGQRRETLRRPKGEDYNDLGPSPDGALWVTRGGPARNVLHVWDSRQGTQWRTLTGPGATAVAFAFAPGRKTGAVGTFAGQLVFWDVAGGRPFPMLRDHNGRVTCLTYSPDGRHLVTGGADGVIHVWDAATHRPLLRLKGHTGEITFLTFSPDGKALASGGTDGTARRWDLATLPEGRPGPQAPPPQLTLEGRVLLQPALPSALACSPDGRWLATAVPTGAVLVDARTGAMGQKFLAPEAANADDGRARNVIRVTFSPDSRTLATGDWDSCVRLWDVADGRLRRTLVGKPAGVPEPRHPVGSVVFSPDGKLLAAGFGNPGDHDLNYQQVVKVWDADSGDEVTTLAGPRNTVPALAFSPDGGVLAAACHDRTVRLWEVGSWRPLRTLTGPSMFKSVAFAPPGGATLFAGSADGTVRRWEMGTGRALPPLTGHDSIVYEVAVSPDGRTLASIGGDRAVRLWDVAGGAYLRAIKGHNGIGMSVVFTPDGNGVASTATDFTLRLWEAASPEAVAAELAEERARREAERAREALYLSNWLTLDPIPLPPGQSADDGLEAEVIAGEAALKPRAGDTARAGDQELAWQENQDADPVFGHIFEGKFPSAHRAAYAVCYLRTEEPRADLRLSLRGKDEPAKVYLNGQVVLHNRPGVGGDTTATVALPAGTSVLVAKIINKRRMWRWCLALTDRDGRPAYDIQVRNTP